jgi:hypothetical protein
MRKSGGFLEFIQYLTGTIFFDGVSKYKCGREVFQPCFLVINQLGKTVRFLPRFVLLLGMMSTSCTISMDEFLVEIVKELNEAHEKGVIILLNKKYYLVKLKITGIVMDLVERFKVLAMVGTGGYFACLYCYIKGESLNKHVYYPPETCDTRDTTTFKMDQCIASSMNVNNDKFKAFRGVTDFHKLQLTDVEIPRCAPFEEMHVTSGVQLKLIMLWIEDLLTTQHIQKINGIMRRILSPFHISRTPKEIDKSNKWKCDETKIFTMIIGPVVMKYFLSEYVYNHYMKFVKGFIIFKLKRIHKGVTYVGDEFYKEFYKEAKTVYKSICACTLKVHTLTHCGECSRDFGTSDEMSAKLFEDLNGMMIKGSDGKVNILEQLVINFNSLRYGDQMVSTLPGIDKDTFYYQTVKLLTCNRGEILRGNWEVENDTLSYAKISKDKENSNDERYNILNNMEVGISSGDVQKVSEKINFDGTEYRTLQKETRLHSNSNIMYFDKEDTLCFGAIEWFIKVNNEWKVLPSNIPIWSCLQLLIGRNCMNLQNIMLNYHLQAKQ